MQVGIRRGSVVGAGRGAFVCVAVIAGACTSDASAPATQASISDTEAADASEPASTAGRSVGEAASSSSAQASAVPEIAVEDEAVVNAPTVTVNDAAAPPGVESIEVPEVGATAWAVVVAGASDPFDPLLGETVELVAAAGHRTTITNCDVGAAAALGMQPQVSFTVSVYAADQSSADRLAESLEAVGLPGVVTEVSAVCP